MIIDVPKPLIELLFVRDVWGLPVGRDLPAADPQPDRGGSTRPGRPEVVAQWEELWTSALEHLAAPTDDDFWGLRYGLEGIDLPSMRAWKNTVTRQIEAVGAEFHHAPETLLRPELTTAERRGLKSLILLPVQGPYARASGADQLLISTTTYLTPAHLRPLIEAFGQ